LGKPRRKESVGSRFAELFSIDAEGNGERIGDHILTGGVQDMEIIHDARY
jgi:hypothetical protein